MSWCNLRSLAAGLADSDALNESLRGFTASLDRSANMYILVPDVPLIGTLVERARPRIIRRVVRLFSAGARKAGWRSMLLAHVRAPPCVCRARASDHRPSRLRELGALAARGKCREDSPTQTLRNAPRLCAKKFAANPV